MSYFCFDGDNFNTCKSLGEAMKEANEAIECYADQCDPGWPEEVENVAYGVILGMSVSEETTGEGGEQYVDYKVFDPYGDHMRAPAGESSDRYDLAELVRAIYELPCTQIPSILCAVLEAAVSKEVFKNASAMFRYITNVLERFSVIPYRIPSQAVNPDGLHRRYHIEYASGEPVDPRGIYYVLRLDNEGDDPVHLEACRVAARAYADFVNGDGRAGHLAQAGSELRDLTIRYDVEANSRQVQ